MTEESDVNYISLQILLLDISLCKKVLLEIIISNSYTANIKVDDLLRKLRTVGVSVDGFTDERQVPSNASLIVTYTHSIREVLHRMLKVSDNLYAESMFYQLAASGGVRWCSAKQGRNYENALFARLGLNPRDYNVADDSGLSLYNYVSAELEIQLLQIGRAHV